MSKLINRRDFATGMVVLGASAAAIPSIAGAARRYSVAFRHYGRVVANGMSMSFWIRVLDKSNFSGSVPVTVQLATDSGLKGVIWLGTGVASQAGSHIVRVNALLTDQQLSRNVALYAGVFAGDPPMLAKVRQVRRNRGA